MRNQLALKILFQKLSKQEEGMMFVLWMQGSAILASLHPLPESSELISHTSLNSTFIRVAQEKNRSWLSEPNQARNHPRWLCSRSAA
jgi:hypothetical protein